MRVGPGHLNQWHNGVKRLQSTTIYTYTYTQIYKWINNWILRVWTLQSHRLCTDGRTSGLFLSTNGQPTKIFPTRCVTVCKVTNPWRGSFEQIQYQEKNEQQWWTWQKHNSPKRTTLPDVSLLKKTFCGQMKLMWNSWLNGRTCLLRNESRFSRLWIMAEVISWCGHYLWIN